MIEPRIIAATVLVAASGCQEPPPRRGDRVDPPKLEQEREQVERFRREAHEDALTAALPVARAALVAGDPFGAWQAGLGPAAIPLVTLGQRALLDDQLVTANTALAEIDESYLSPASVVILRAVSFGIARLDDELGRRTPVRRDPMLVLHAIEAVLDELVYRLVHEDCDATCETLADELALALPDARTQWVAASWAGSQHASVRAATLAERSRELAGRSLLDGHAALRGGLGQLAAALDDHREFMQGLADGLALHEPARTWTDKPGLIRPDAPKIERLPDVLGPLALIRRLAAEELLTLDPERDLVRVAEHVHRWQALRRVLVEGQMNPIPRGAPSTVDVERCEAALVRIGAGLREVEGVEAPRLRCDRYVDLLGARRLAEPELVLALLDLGVIEPQRRALRNQELAEIALIGGRWSTQVHTHLRRVMLLAQIDDPPARDRAIDEGLEALCLAEAALWIHAELAVPDAVADAIGPKCAALGDAAALRERVLGDPRGALAGLGLSLIGDEPARMVGFDRFFWAPLGLMQTLATPNGMHPDRFTLPDERPGAAPTNLQFHPLDEEQ